jgi:hypothetical protein
MSGFKAEDSQTRTKELKDAWKTLYLNFIAKAMSLEATRLT